MPLKAKAANKVTTNEQGLIEGTIIEVLDIPENYKNSKGEPISKEEYDELKAKGKQVQRFEEQFEFKIQMEGTQKNVTKHIWTRQKFNNEKYEKTNKVKDYNDFTRLMLQLELIQETDLDDLENLAEDFDVESVIGIKITFELEASKKSITYKVPKLTSIKPIKLPK